MAMGWDGYHLQRFIKGDTYYLPPKDRTGDCFFEGALKQFDSGMLSLGELLSRKGSKIKYCLLYTSIFSVSCSNNRMGQRKKLTINR